MEFASLCYLGMTALPMQTAGWITIFIPECFSIFLTMDLPHQCSLGQGRGVIPATVKMGTAYATSSSVEKGGFLAFACPSPPGCRGASLARGTYNIHSWSWGQHDGLGCPPPPPPLLHCQRSWSPDEKHLKHLSIGQIYDFSWPPF